MNQPWRTRKDKRKYQKRERDNSKPDSRKENEARKKLVIRSIRRIGAASPPGKAILGRESFTPREVEIIIAKNKEIVTARGEGFEVDPDRLDKIFRRMDRYNTVSDRRERLVMKSAVIMSGISFGQPFFEGNRETALFTGKLLLQLNGMDLPVKTLEEAKDAYDLLTRTTNKSNVDKTILSEVADYLRGRVISLLPE